MKIPHHMELEELEVFKAYLEDTYEASLQEIGIALSEISMEHGFCHHNMIEICYHLTSVIFNHAVSNLPEELQTVFIGVMEHELKEQGIIILTNDNNSDNPNPVN